jgi:hypothetical protein
MMDDDIKVRPEWEKYTPKFSWTGDESNIMTEMTVKAKATLAGCPFAAFLQ